MQAQRLLRLLQTNFLPTAGTPFVETTSDKLLYQLQAKFF